MLETFETKQRSQLRKMRVIATSLLCFMMLFYVVSRILENQLHFMRFATAFSEAGIIGALADWFAVVALFKHPLGIPIWHTAIITEKKKEIARTLAHFVVENFLTRSVIGKKMEDYDLSTNAGSLLVANTEIISAKVIETIPSFFGLLNDKDIQILLHEQVSNRLSNVNLAPLAGEILDTLTSHEKFHELFKEVIHAVQKIARENKAFIANQVRSVLPGPEFVGWSGFKDNIAEWLSKIISEKIKETTKDLENDQSHELRKSFEKQLKKTIHDLKTSPELAAKGETILRMILEHPALKEYLLGLWADIKKLLIEDAKKPDSSMKKQLAGLIDGIANRILKEDPFRSRINYWIRENVLTWIEKYKGEVRNTIIKTVENWKDEEIVGKLELSVGKDLQYIRLNGTIVGGLAGLTLYTIYQGVLHFGPLWAK
jgi:uncharacterized membrane-anchored protein YjiN (DUF445 family)